MSHLDTKLTRLLTLIRDKMECESIFLTPLPQWTIDVVVLLDGIAEIYEVSKEDIGAIVNRDEEQTNG